MRILLGFCAVSILLGTCGLANAQTESKDKFTPPSDFKANQLKVLKEENELLKKQVQALTRELEQLKAPMGAQPRLLLRRK